MWKMLLHLHVNQNLMMMMMMINKNIQPTVDCEMTTKYSAILFVNLGEYIFKFMNLTQILMITSNNLLIVTQPKNIVPYFSSI